MIENLTAFFIRPVELVAHYRTILLFLVCPSLGALGAWLVAGTAFR